MKNDSDLAWKISGLTKIIGDSFCSSSNDGRNFSWWSKKHEYFFTLEINDDGEFFGDIREYWTHHPKLYAILGYCIYHRIRVNDQWISWLSNSGESKQ